MDRALDQGIAEIVRGQVPGLSAAIVRPEGTVMTIGLGIADLRSSTPATPNTIYPWFSMTKLVTATCVMQPVERGQLDLDGPVSTHYPAILDLRPRRWAEAVTIRTLLNHTAGLVNPMPIAWIHMANEPAPDPDKFLMGLLVKSRRLRAAPGSTAVYSNLGYLVLGRIVVHAAGQSYQDYVRNHVLAPLGMKSTDFIVRDDMAPLAATGYQKRWNMMTPLFHLLLPRDVMGRREGGFIALNRFYVDGDAYGGLIGSVVDAARFLQAHLSGSGGGVRLLSSKSVELMRALTAHGAKLDVGLGWYRHHSSPRGDFVEHWGGGGGFFAAMRLYPAAGFGLVMIGNATRFDHQSILDRLAGRAQHGDL